MTIVVLDTIDTDDTIGAVDDVVKADEATPSKASWFKTPAKAPHRQRSARRIDLPGSPRKYSPSHKTQNSDTRSPEPPPYPRFSANFSRRSGVPSVTLRNSFIFSIVQVSVNEVSTGTYQLFSPVRLTSR